MKIIHCADLHLDSKIDTIPSDKARTRRDEILRTFERLCDYAVRNDVTAVIIAGDMFDTSRVSIKTRGRILQAISSADGVDFLYLSGNHDDDNFLSNLEEVPNNLKVFGDEWTKFRYDNVTISGVKLNSKNSGTFYDNLILEEGEVNIVTLHGQIVGYKSDDAAEIISTPRLKGKNIDYLALGHIHKYAEGQLDSRGKYAYSGCLDGRGFDETGEKGFVLIDVKNNKTSYEFIPFSSRCLYEVELNVDGFDSWFEFKDFAVKELTGGYPLTSLIKVVLKGRHTIDFIIDKEGLAKRLGEEFFFVKVYDRTDLKYNIEDYANDKSVLGEFIRAIDESDMENHMKNEVIMCGINALKGEDF